MDKKVSKKRSNLKDGIIKLSVCAMLIGISIVVGSVCRYYLTFGVFVRVTFENLPIILSGILFGPVYGMCVGLCTDLISCVATAQEINPIITMGALSVGLVSGMLSKILNKFPHKKIKTVISCVSAHIIGCLFIKTYGLHVYYFPTTSFWYLFGIRAAVYALIASVETLILLLILSDNYIKGFSDYEL